MRQGGTNKRNRKKEGKNEKGEEKKEYEVKMRQRGKIR